MLGANKLRTIYNQGMLTTDPADRLWMIQTLRADQNLRATLPCRPSDASRLVRASRHEGVLALIHARWAADPTTAPADASLLSVFAACAREQAARSLLMQAEASRVLAVFHGAGLRVLVLKGMALAQWLYPATYLRPSGDLDLLLKSRSDAELARDLLADAGYPDHYVSGRHGYEVTCRPGPDASRHLEVDLHWRIQNVPLFANTLDFETLWAASVPLAGLHPEARGSGPVHAMTHAAMNRVVNIYNGLGDRLHWLYDIHLLSRKFEQRDWQGLTRLAIDLQLCGVVQSALEAAIRDLNSTVPEFVLGQLQCHAENESLNATRMGDWKYMQFRNLMALPWHQRASWVFERLLPDMSYLRHFDKTNDSTTIGLIGKQAARLARRVLPRPSARRPR